MVIVIGPFVFHSFLPLHEKDSNCHHTDLFPSKTVHNRQGRQITCILPKWPQLDPHYSQQHRAQAAWSKYRSECSLELRREPTDSLSFLHTRWLNLVWNGQRKTWTGTWFLPLLSPNIIWRNNSSIPHWLVCNVTAFNHLQDVSLLETKIVLWWLSERCKVSDSRGQNFCQNCSSTRYEPRTLC